MGTNITKVIMKGLFFELQGNTSIPSRRIVINMPKTQFLWRAKRYVNTMMEVPGFFYSQYDAQHELANSYKTPIL